MCTYSSPPQEPPEGPRSERKKQRKYATIYVSLFSLKVGGKIHRACVRTLVLRRSPRRACGARGKNKENTVLFTYLFSYLRIHIQHNVFTAVAFRRSPRRARGARGKNKANTLLFTYLFCYLRIHIQHNVFPP